MNQGTPETSDPTARAEEASEASPDLLTRGVSAVLDRCEAAYDRLFHPARRTQFGEATVRLALLGLAVHLGLVFLARSLGGASPLPALIGTNYLAALYTPFTFILFYEVLLLILSIPESTTQSIGKQYEILSLIVIRNVFKDIAEFETVTHLDDMSEEFGAILLDAGGGLIMFLLVAVFYHINSRRPKAPDRGGDYARKVQKFIGRKKAVSLLLSVLLFALAAFNLLLWLIDVVSVARSGSVPTIDVKTVFYLDLFNVMIFADAAILILSLRVSSQYELVFRNAAFVVSTILLRFSIALSKPYDVELGIVAIAFGTLVLLIYNYYLRVDLASGASMPDDEEEGGEGAAASSS